MNIHLKFKINYDAYYVPGRGCQRQSKIGISNSGLRSDGQRCSPWTCQLCQHPPDSRVALSGEKSPSARWDSSGQGSHNLNLAQSETFQQPSSPLDTIWNHERRHMERWIRRSLNVKVLFTSTRSVWLYTDSLCFWKFPLQKYILYMRLYIYIYIYIYICIYIYKYALAYYIQDFIHNIISNMPVSAITEHFSCMFSELKCLLYPESS